MTTKDTKREHATIRFDVDDLRRADEIAAVIPGEYHEVAA